MVARTCGVIDAVRSSEPKWPALRSSSLGSRQVALITSGLAAAFKARLDEEGGETAFRLKTDANNLAESAKETASAAGSKIANLLDVGGRRAGPGMMDPGSWNLTVAFFVGLIVVSVAGAVVNRPPSGGNDPYIYNNAGYGGIDKFTSDGQPLEFGSRY